jgi:acyl transferase domain-containing protein/phosphopantetheinyl transferase (holo-ACP synthase)|nr:beta-ketoacyl synthase N-terminal-like domain-containing protein [Kofleriaceae bacterium]
MSEPRDAIAIVGMAVAFPGAPDLATFAANLEAGVDAISDAPTSRIDAELARTLPCTRGGFIAPTFDAAGYGIMPRAAAGVEPDQLLALDVAAAALADAGIESKLGSSLDRARAGVVLGRGGYFTPGVARLANRVRTAAQLAVTLRELLPDLDAATIDAIRGAFAARAGEIGPDAAIGLVPNLAASRIANRLDLRGPAYTVDAACASSLLAVDQACGELARGRCDLMVAGGVHVCHDITLWSVFAQLGALSKAAQIRPFDRRADGILIGEGCGVVVLERLADAERAGRRIYAVIRGTGVSSDGRESTAMRPRADGQLAALAQAWRGLDPATVGMVEAHGTATVIGDEVELSALGEHFGAAGARPRAVVGSVKSMIGHAMPAAGAAGLIKTALALHRGVVMPSLHCDEPHPALERTRFRVPREAEPWPDDLPRRAGVSAFGFGGINAHVVVDSASVLVTRTRSPRRDRDRAAPADGIARYGADSLDALTAAVADDRRGDGALRLAIVDPTAERRELAAKVIDRGKPWRGKHDIFFAPAPLARAGGKLALLFPGVEATFAPDRAAVAAIADTLGVAAPAAIGDATGATGGSALELEVRGRGVFALGNLLASALAHAGLRADAYAGHSLGEWTGMVASEMIPRATADAFVASLVAGTLDVPDVVFAAVGCGAAGAREALAGLDAIGTSHDNCPHQSIVCGRAASVRTALQRLAARGVLCQELPFKSGFHSPLFAPYLAPHRAHFAELALQRPSAPLWSATTCAPYPADPAAIRALAIDHLVQPVRFRELVQALYADGVRAFVQLGVGSIVGFVDDTLRGHDVLAIAAAAAKPGPQLARVIAALWADGWSGGGDPASDVGPRRIARGAPLQLGSPLIRLGDAVPPIVLPRSDARSPRPDACDDPVVAELLATFDEAAAASRAIVEAYRAANAPSRHVARRSLSVAAEPALLDHCFYRQPAGWPTVSDRYPVVPMTMTIQMMIDAAAQLAPGRVAVAVEDVRAFRWLAVAPAVDVELTATRRAGEPDVIDVDVPGYARAGVRFADRFAPAPPSALAPLANPRPAPVSARDMYDHRWMFHGPAYQGVSALGPIGDDGVDGAIDTLPAPGALLDCAGQLMGWWVMHTETHDRLAMPVHIARIAFHAPAPAPGTRVPCRVRVRQVGEREVRADLELGDYARITGWEDRRFDSDDAVWRVLMYPETHALAEPHAIAAGVVIAREHWRGAASRELMMRRYLGDSERVAHDAMTPRARRGWLLGRIAAKDAVRRALWAAQPDRAVWPVEIAIANAASGQPYVAGGPGAHVAISIAHADDVAVAIADATPGARVGVDIERVAPRHDDAAFAAVAYAPGELALGAAAGRDAADWATRVWAAKEAVGKLRGTGVTDPRKLVVRAVDGDRLVIDDVSIDTRRDGDHVVAVARSLDA